MAAQQTLAPEPVVEMQMQPASAGTMGMIERAVSDPNFNAENFKTLVEFRDREIARNAEAAFNASMHAAQAEMRPIEADGYNKATSSKYATYAKLDKALRPIYSKHGFSLSFNTIDSPLADNMRVLCYASHTAGHTRVYQIDLPTDGKGAKGNDVMTKTHAVGAGASYGMRYLLKMIWNVLVGEDDRDGNSAEQEIEDPEGFIEWWDDMDTAALDGMASFRAAWDASPAAFRQHAVKHYRQQHEARKARAAKVARS